MATLSEHLQKPAKLAAAAEQAACLLNRFFLEVHINHIFQRHHRRIRQLMRLPKLGKQTIVDQCRLAQDLSSFGSNRHNDSYLTHFCPPSVDTATRYPTTICLYFANTRLTGLRSPAVLDWWIFASSQ